MELMDEVQGGTIRCCIFSRIRKRGVDPWVVVSVCTKGGYHWDDCALLVLKSELCIQTMYNSVL